MTTTTKVQWDGQVRIEARDQLPKKAGLYCLHDGDTPLYVGRSRSIWQRWQNHEVLVELQAYRARGFVHIRWCLSEHEPTPEEEQAYINSLTPIWNASTAHKATSDKHRIRRPLYLDPEQADWVDAEIFKRKKAGKAFEEYGFSAIVREALDAYMKEAK